MLGSLPLLAPPRWRRDDVRRLEETEILVEEDMSILPLSRGEESREDDLFMLSSRRLEGVREEAVFILLSIRVEETLDKDISMLSSR